MVTNLTGGGGPQGHSFTNIVSATTTVVCARPCNLIRIVINKKVASGAITMYDNASAASGTKIGIITNPATLLDNAQQLDYEVYCSNGLTIVTAQADDITVVWD